MKLTKLLSLLLALMMVFALAGCDKADKDDDKKDSKPSLSQEKEELSAEELIVGEWVCDLTVEQLAEVYGMEAEDIETMGLDGMKFSLDFQKDGAVMVEMEVAGEVQESEDEYEFEGNTLYIAGDEQEYEFIDEDTLLLTMDGVELEFERK